MRHTVVAAWITTQVDSDQESTFELRDLAAASQRKQPPVPTPARRLHKALTQMNVQIHHVISDITGTTGLAIVDAILAGQRDPVVLATLRDARIKASEETIRKSLVGNRRPEHLFTLKQSRELYRAYQPTRSATAD